MGTRIGRITATESMPSTIDEFYFWTKTDVLLSPFDVVRVDHIAGSKTFGIVQEISHITDAPGFLTNYISNDFGDCHAAENTLRVGMNYVKCTVIYNDRNIDIPVHNNSNVELANQSEIEDALGFSSVKDRNPINCGYLEMYGGMKDEEKIRIPVPISRDFLIGPEGAHLNISGISGLAAKTSYAMFLLKSIQDKLTAEDTKDTAFIFVNVKGRDLLAIDQEASDQQFKSESDKERTKKEYAELGLPFLPFKNVTYYYPHWEADKAMSYISEDALQEQMNKGIAKRFKYECESDVEHLDLFFSNIDDPNQTMDAILNEVLTSNEFTSNTIWKDLLAAIEKRTRPSATNDKTIPIVSWRKFYRLLKKQIDLNGMFANRADPKHNECRLETVIMNIQANDVFVIDIAKQDENMQSFVFGHVMRIAQRLRLGEYDQNVTAGPQNIPKRIVVFVDELNKYASRELPKSAPILQQLLDVAERGRSLGLILFAAEQFKSAIHDRVSGNCATHAYGRTNSTEVAKPDYKYLPASHRTIMTRLQQGEYIISNPTLRTPLRIKFPKPVYYQHK